MYKDNRVIAIITAGGRGRRMGSEEPKQFIRIHGTTILEMAVRPFARHPLVDQILVTVPSGYQQSAEELLMGLVDQDHKGTKDDGSTDITLEVIAGGEERQDSVALALKHLSIQEQDIILVHDGVRPYCSQDIIDRVVLGAAQKGACICGIQSTDTLRHRTDGTIDREQVVRVQTPQGFRAKVILDAYETAAKDGFRGTDDAMLAERIGQEVEIVEGSYSNIKITTPEDLPMDIRTGIGFDVHRLVHDRKLIMGGVEIPFDLGLEGHSDADVLTHAIMDAVLGAAGLPDIGNLFPDDDPTYEGACSIKLLEEVAQRITEKGYKVANVDSTIICERPKMAPYIDEMKEKLGEALLVTPEAIGIKATTTEKLGFTGRGEGIACQAICTLKK